MFKDTVTGKPIPVSEKSAATINQALVAARDSGAISDHEYAMVYAECCEVGRLPQMFGGRSVDPNMMHEWQTTFAWRDIAGPRVRFDYPNVM